jgi:radical SAM superfamily enzyme YgiQ (UPF0313 family)
MKVDKICLINPPTTDPSERSLYFPMALLTLGGVLRKLGVRAELWDFDLYFKRIGNQTEREFRDLLRHGIEGVRTHLFGISSICSNLPMAIWIAKEIKAQRKDAVVILGGPQPSSVPGELLKAFDFIDVVAIGEGEITLEEMVRTGFEPDQFSKIPGLAYRTESGISINEKRALVQDMDELPYPDYSLIRFEDYQSVEGQQFLPHVEVGRGCPYSCTFCSTALMWEKDFRVKSPKRILAEMESLYREHGFKDVDFIHDNFTTSKKFIMEFCEFMETHNTNKLTWNCSSRTDCIDVPRLERMHSVGLRGLFFGLESGSERMQKIIRKGLRFERFEPILLRANELGLNATTAFILGFPEETAADMDQTVLRALHYRLIGTPRIFFSKLSALTGTSVYRDNKDKFTEFSKPSSISPQNYALPYIQKLIRDHPSLFSSFYHVPHPEFSAEYLAKFIEFAHHLIYGSPQAAQLVMENLDIRPTRLFSLWDDWASKRGIPYFNYRAFTKKDFGPVFQAFLDDVVFGDVHELVMRSSEVSPLPVAMQIPDALSLTGLPVLAQP